ncbi:MAG: hypothetical protein JXR46_03375 [Calditrichaceae bacterium]|nr:hypothetical protein [Calditrichaceae bacterium]
MGIDISGINENNWKWHAREQYQSDMLIPTMGMKQWKDEHRLNTDFAIQTGSAFTGIYVNSWLQSDQQQIKTENLFSNHAMGLFSNIGKSAKWSITPYAGYQQQRTKTKIDWGWDLGVHGELRALKLGDYSTRLMGESNYDFYNQLQNFENRFNISINRNFTSFTRDSLIFSFTESSKDNYTLPDYEKINTIKINKRQLQNKLFYLLSARNLFSLVTQVQSRNLVDFNERKILYIENQFNYLHAGDNLNYGLSFRTNIESQDNDKTITDSETKETVINIHTGFRISEKDRLNLELSYVKFQYDTPDDLNKDDRDEQRFVMQGEYRRRFSPYLTMDWLAYAYLYHQIFIFKERSANNNWNRVLKLNPRVSYRTHRFSNNLSTEVTANYTVYDFENELLRTRSIVFRKYVFSDSLNFKFLPWISAGGFIRVELEDKGTFYKKQFAQQIIQEYDSQLYNIYLMHYHFLNFQMRLGYSYYRREEIRYLPLNTPDRVIRNHGPYLNFVYKGSEHIVLTVDTNFINLDDSLTGVSSYVTGNIRMNYLF